MQVLVLVKEVVEVADDFEIDGASIADRSVEYGLNEWDEYAVEAGVQIKESTDETEVVSVTIGPERTEEVIRMALAKGVDRAIRVWDDSLDRDLLDVGAKTALLEAVLEDESPDLVLAGVQAGDDVFGATGVSLARAVGFEWAAVVSSLRLDADGGIAHVRRELEGGVEELVDVELPAVLTIQTGINEPRYASLRGIRQAQSKEIDHRTPADLGVGPAAIEPELDLLEMYLPESSTATEFFEGRPDEQAEALADALRDLGVGAA